jgi:hypothetical protein
MEATQQTAPTPCRDCGHERSRHFTSHDGKTRGCGECYKYLGMVDAYQCEGYEPEH